MKIPNYDRKIKENSKKLNNIFDEDFRLLIAGESGCGKTNTLMHILRKPLGFFLDFKEIMDSISKKVGYPVLELNGPDEIKNTNEYQPENRKIVVFDDVITAPEKIQNKIANHWTDGRHHGISPIYLSQSYYDTPQKLRLNCSNMILYPPTTKNHKNLIAKENLIDTNHFDQLNPFEFLFLDKKKKSVTKNFDEKV